MTLQRFRQIEFWVITALTALFLFIALATDYRYFSRVWFQLEALEQQRIYLRYDWVTNGLWPILSIFLTLYGSWYVLNRVIIPRYWPDQLNFFVVGSLLISIVVLTGAWSYLYSWKELKFRHDINYSIIGAKVLSSFRLRNLALLSGGLVLALSLYTLLSQAYQWALQQTETNVNHKVIKDGSSLAFIGFVLWTAFQMTPGNFFFIPSLIWVQGAFIHAYLYHTNLLRWRTFAFRQSNENRQAFLNLFTALAISFGSSIVWVLLHDSFRNYLYGYNAGDVLAFWLVSWLGALAVTLIRQFMVRPLETNLNRNQAELSALRAQINPHFLFNAMNTLYATAIEENAEKTSHGIQQLSDMMRFMMHENNQEQIDVQQEVAYLRNYIDLQRLRLSESDKLELKVDLDDALCLRSIAPMLLIPFVENAFKHGISLRNASWIFIKLYCHREKLHFSVFNSIHPRHEEDPEKYSSGIGLVNVQKRLELLYPQNHDLRIHRTEKEFSVQLAIDFAKKGKKLNSILATYDQL
ncbi:sensor histidine kinase [Runella slithyformis]|uniref:Signal transduction histidine kinase n=1 Tax=Runella slithyformis (strain ATCC 29530 / DSM 19594 / LMG 11500 / NCIMB 11436 / LSU 4) TaxID=761193 RepID=A0A7U4E5P0_RUNSL|nr:histidine kinase [Runella slithyformis]AEI48761.1 putative signal transduction histidine kinase [Runella slithyformis DSM 19594]